MLAGVDGQAVAAEGAGRTYSSTWSYAASIGATIVAALTWPQSETYAASAGLAMIAWTMLMALRTTTIHRSDQNWLDRLIVVLMAPVTAFWVAFVLRAGPGSYGITTFLRQGWVTRNQVKMSHRSSA